ncbi:chlorophyllase-2 [Silene latifolia]|uniref:chlorophyllase-2 n=1 Tax=Silene latifolia TaxID=37657 RepID=UPI003D7841E3
MSVFDDGDYPTVLLKIEPKRACADERKLRNSEPPTPLLIATPSKEGEFPVLLLIHGYLLYIDFYSQLIQHIASHGFIVIAPQLYTIAGPDTTGEIHNTAAIIKWLPTGLKDVLPSSVLPKIDKLAISGHSRGGKVAFALALNKLTTSSLKISALIGIDPVDGMDKGKQTPPAVLSYVPKSFNLEGMPTLVIGSGYGEMKKNAFFPACAPKGVNHENFYDECQNPAWYFLVEDQGHLDMLDDETKGVRGKSTYCLAKNGKSREPMRRFVGGVIVAFLNAYLQGYDSQLLLIKDGNDATPVSFSKVDHR